MHSPSKNVIKHFHTIPFKFLITMMEIEDGRSFNRLLCLRQLSGFSFDAASEILDLFILIASEKTYIAIFVSW